MIHLYCFLLLIFFYIMVQIDTNFSIRDNSYMIILSDILSQISGLGYV